MSRTAHLLATTGLIALLSAGAAAFAGSVAGPGVISWDSQSSVSAAGTPVISWDSAPADQHVISWD